MLSEIFPEVDGGNEKLESLLRLTAASKQKHGSVLHVACCKPQPSPVQCAYYSSITPSAPRVGFGCTYDLFAGSVSWTTQSSSCRAQGIWTWVFFALLARANASTLRRRALVKLSRCSSYRHALFFCAACSSPVSANCLMRIHTSDIHLRMTRMSNTFAI